MRGERTFRETVEKSPECFEPPKALYIHVPFCRTRCSYCDFHSFDCRDLRPDLLDSYIQALVDRIRSFGSPGSGWIFSDVETIYIGGGTPTSLPDKGFTALLAALRSHSGNRVAEWTVEANPESLSLSKINAMKISGVTRVSLGIQSMDDEELAILGRRGTAELNEKAIRAALDSGLAVSADLISGLPSINPVGRRRSRLADSVRTLINSGLTHLSLYDLTIEKGTRLAARIDSGELVPMDEDEAYDERKAAEALLGASGFRRYEVSNFALDGAQSRHNSIYWEMLSYIGLGSGAVSTLSSAASAIREGLPAALRITETKDLQGFLSNPDSEMELESIPARVAAFETVMMGLRTARGIDSQRFAGRFGIKPAALFPASLEKWAERFKVAETSLSLDDQGMDVLNSILVDIGAEMDSVPTSYRG